MTCRPPDQAARFILSIAYGANAVTSYMLMLAIMTFNVGYFIVVVTGLSVGHYIFSFFFGGGLEAGGSMLSELCCAQD